MVRQISSYYVKLIFLPVFLLLASWIGLLGYDSFFYPLTTGLVLAVVSRMMDVYFLKPGTLWQSNLADFASFTFLVYASQWLFPGSTISMTGAIVTGVLFTVMEHFMHRYLINQKIPGRR